MLKNNLVGLEMKSGIYCIKHIASEKVYIGSAVNIKNRWQNHKAALRNSRHHSKKMQRAWDKYGEKAFVFSVLEIVPDKNNLIEREQYWLNKYQSARCGYNCRPTAGSNLGHKDSDEVRAKKSLVHKGVKKSKEHVAKVAAALRGKKGVRTGMVTSPETRLKQSIAATGRKMPAAARAKFDAMTPEQRSAAAKKAWATKRANKLKEATP